MAKYPFTSAALVRSHLAPVAQIVAQLADGIHPLLIRASEATDHLAQADPWFGITQFKIVPNAGKDNGLPGLELEAGQWQRGCRLLRLQSPITCRGALNG